MEMACASYATGTWSEAKVRTRLWVYRVGGFLLINVIDDPAWLALMFC